MIHFVRTLQLVRLRGDTSAGPRNPTDLRILVALLTKMLMVSVSLDFEEARIGESRALICDIQGDIELGSGCEHVRTSCVVR